MASPDESGADDARDPSGTPASPASQEASVEPQPVPSGEAQGGEPGRGAAAPGRPRGTASFPGGPPPASTPAAPLVTPPAAAQAVESPPRFQVTTVETTAAASFPGGPPPARTGAGAGEPAPQPAGGWPASADGLAGGDGGAAPGRRRAGQGRRRAAAIGDQSPTAGDADAATPLVDSEPGATAAATTDTELSAATQAPPSPEEAIPAPAAPWAAEAAPGGAAPGAAAVEAGPGAAGAADGGAIGAEDGRVTEVGPGADGGAPARPSGGRRRRRGRRASRADAGTGRPGEPDGAAAVPPGSPAGPGAGEAALVQGPDGRVAAAGLLDRGPAADGEEAGDPDEGPGGSARTRARRRRRAAAKARVRTDSPAEEAVPAAEGGPGPAAGAPPGPAGPEAAPARRARLSRSRPGQRGTPAAAMADAAPAAAKSERPPRGRGRGRLGAAAKDRAEASASISSPDPAAEPAARTAPAGPAAAGPTRLDSRGRASQGSRQADRGRRRRSSGLTEEQKRVLREDGPAKRMLVTEGAERTQIGVLEGRTLVEHYVTRKAGRSFVGNIYLGRVQNVLPGMEAAFVDIGKGRNAVLYAGEVNYNEEDLDGEAPRIERALKPGQSVLVQVTKDPIGAKGARLTAQVSLAGRYLVLQPEDNTFGISRRLPEEERSRLREILKEVRPKGLGLIVRTAAEGATADDLRADLARLQARWEAVERKAKNASAPAVIYSEPELVVRVIRDIFSPDFVELVVDAPELHERVEDYLEEVAPDLLPKLRRHEARLPLFEHHHVVEQIHKALERKVWLPSGGSIVIDRTEAMTVVDVNTGKFVGKSNLEETVVANNLEAADEIVRQLRLRDIGGIIIIDFIDMLFERNQQEVVERLRAALARDKTKSQVMEVSSLGLVQMTRKRVSGGLLESFSETCPACEGRGVVITHDI